MVGLGDAGTLAQLFANLVSDAASNPGRIFRTQSRPCRMVLPATILSVPHKPRKWLARDSPRFGPGRRRRSLRRQFVSQDQGDCWRPRGRRPKTRSRRPHSGPSASL